MTVVLDPLDGEVSYLIEVPPVILRLPLVGYGPVKPLNLGVLLRLTWLDVFEDTAVLLRPSLDHSTDIFQAVIAPNNVGSSPSLNDLFQSPDNPFRWQRKIDLNA